MKTHKALLLILVLVIITGIAAWFHLASREEVAEGTLQITVSGNTQTIELAALDYAPVSGVRVNGKGETISVEGRGILVKDLLASTKIASYSKVTVVSDDSYTAELTAEEVAEDGKAWLLLEQPYLRLVVFGDQNSKRSVSNVVQIIVE